MANTFELIASSTVGSGGASSINFNSIPSTYTDLCLEVSGRTTNWGYSYNNLYLSINGAPSGSAYSNCILYSVGTSAGSFSQSGTSQLLIGATPSTAGTANTFSNTFCYIPNYAGSNYKSTSSDGVSERNSGTNGDIFLSLIAGLWSSTSAITSLSLTSDSSTFEQYSTAYLYGVKNS
jgi:hypothetical protein